MTIALKEQLLMHIRKLLAPPEPQTKAPTLDEAIAEAHERWTRRLPRPMMSGNSPSVISRR